MALSMIQTSRRLVSSSIEGVPTLATLPCPPQPPQRNKENITIIITLLFRTHIFVNFNEAFFSSPRLACH